MQENVGFTPVPEDFPISVRLPEGAIADSIVNDASASSRPGDLVNQASTEQGWADYFAKQAVVNMPVPLNEILEITTVRNYATPSTSERPIVWRTRDHFFGLDGSEKRDAARLLGETFIDCRVHFVANATAEDLAFAKAAVRMKPEGGPASHAEIVAANASVAGIYTFNRPTMFTNHHGGLRIPGRHNSEAKDNLVNALSKGLGKDRKTILRYLNHSAYLENDILGALADACVVKGFFEEIHKAKIAIINYLTGRNLEPTQIASQVSEAVRAIFDDYQAKSGKLDQEFIKSVVGRFTGDAASAEQQGPEAQTPDAHDHNENAASNTGFNEEDLSVESLLQPSDDPGPFAQRKDRVIERLSFFAAQAVDIKDAEDFNNLARDMLTYAYQLNSELLPHDLDTILEELRAASLG
jgi:hypothetical protein